MEQAVIEYLANALWQLPVLALGAWLLLRMWNPGPAARHRVWLAVLALGLLLPLRGVIGPVRAASGDSPTAVAGEPAVALAALHQGPAAPVVAESAPSAAGSDGGWAALAVLGAYLHRLSVSAAVLNWIVGLWLAVALWGLARLTMAWRSARRLVADSREAMLDNRELEALRECARQIGVKAPEVRESDALAGPVIVRAARPVLLWPEGFARYSGDELRAALLHELAHVRRRDYGMNLLCEAAALPLKWHPVTHAVERQIRATREMACDAIAAEAMESETAYAECLVSLARSIAGGGLEESPAVAGLFNGNVMEERVMRLVRGKSALSMRTRIARGAAGAAAMAAAIALAGAFHVSPAMAQDAPVVPVAPSAPGAVPSTPLVPAPPIIAAVPQARVVPPVPTAQVGAPPPPPPLTQPLGAAAAAPPTPPMSQPPAIAPPPVPETTPPAPPVPQTPAAAPHREKPVVIIDGQQRDLTPAERARIDRQLAEAQKKIAEATAKINSPEFQKQIEEAQRKAFRAQTFLNSAEYKKQMADAQKQIAEANAKINSPEFRKKIQAEIDAAAKVNSEEFQKQIGDAQAAALRARTMLNSPEEWKREMADAQKQVAEATARVNSPEFRKQMEDAVRAAARVNSAEFQKQMADAQKQIADAMARMKAEQKEDSRKKGPTAKGQAPGK
ncbi:MAG TPA: M56 family metallopeptidase [Acidobacteriaceae bacterium]|nr:M56 family metallopeptidase [Acidobacteriaceae bacterium]